jgi:hypothetical protein
MATRKNKSNKSNKFRKSNKSRKLRGGVLTVYGKEKKRLLRTVPSLLSPADLEKRNKITNSIKINGTKTQRAEAIQNQNAEHKRQYKKQQDEIKRIKEETKTSKREKKEAIISLMKKETNEVKKETNKAKRLTNEPIKSQESKKHRSTTYNPIAERETLFKFDIPLTELDIPLTPSIPLNPYSSGGKRKTRKSKRKTRKNKRKSNRK